MLQVKLFDFEHEEDLEEAVNEFLKTLKASQVVDVKYQVAVADCTVSAGTIFCFSAMVLYRTQI